MNNFNPICLQNNKSEMNKFEQFLSHECDYGLAKAIQLFGIKCKLLYENEIPRKSLNEIKQDFDSNGRDISDNHYEFRLPCHFFNRTCMKNNNLVRSYNKIAKNIRKNYHFSCVFCENNKEPEQVYKSHAVRDLSGKVICPKLRNYVCPICGAFGDNAHTIKYCPQKPIITMEDTMKNERDRMARSIHFKHRSL